MVRYCYSEEELKEWVPLVEKATEVKKVYGYFNNHYHGYAVENCIEILEMLGATKSEHQRIKERIIKHNEPKKIAPVERKLEDFGFNASTPTLHDLLLKLTDKARLERGIEITDEEITIREVSNERIKAEIRGYVVEIDLKKKTMLHNCDDWRKSLGIKRLCKHVTKLFLSLPSDESTRILQDIIEDKDSWGFL